ncbi:hypothetical protein EAI_13339 [Harpegnathos saltator]|uniref:Uncharacterized protein n=1 Tax=Harpegnathos saltator TaxID=610380 RepID=E2C0S3_HARSA|nr:hypothetical protein EAI_13339 [Harpegnathos saltator]
MDRANGWCNGAAQGRHEHTREAVGAGAAATASGRRDPGSSSRAKGGTRKAASRRDLALPRPLRGGSGRSASGLVCLKRGMSEGERAVTTPRIGWRKLTDPGD